MCLDSRKSNDQTAPRLSLPVVQLAMRDANATIISDVAHPPVWRRPQLASLLRSRVSCLMIPLIFGSYGLVSSLGLVVWECPLRAGLGRDCPGCGMTRAIIAGLAGRFQDMLQLNLFAPVFGVLFVGLSVAGMMPSAWRLSLADRVARVESRLPLVLIIGGAFVTWGLFRHGGLIGSVGTG
jgi:hypothetical protein